MEDQNDIHIEFVSSFVLRKSDIQAGYPAHGNSYGSAWLSWHRSGGVYKSIGKQSKAKQLT